METCKGCKYYDVKQADGWESKYCSRVNVEVYNPIGCKHWSDDDARE